MNIAVIGAGPAGLMAAEVLSAGGARVTVYDRMPSVGRKFLMAGRGGLNLTHSEPLDRFVRRYREAMPHLRAAIEAFPPEALRAWSEELGQPTFVGSSGRVFPQAMKASPLLRAWLRRLDQSGVRFALRHHWTGWTATGELRFESPEGETLFQPDATVIALGGASWPRLGADGDWIDSFKAKGIHIAPLRAANSGFRVAWSAMDSETLAAFINAVPVRLTGVAGLDRAISTAGGISFDEVDARFMLRKMPGVFIAGEMLDWEAPTGGYLLQACFATGVAAAKGALEYLKR